jgi:hypothetical protein
MNIGEDKEIMLNRRQLLATAVALPSLAWATPLDGSTQTPIANVPADPTLWDYLSLSPASVYSLEQPIAALAGNVQLQVETIGLPFPIDPAAEAQRQEWRRAILDARLPSVISDFTLVDDAAELLGFEVSQIATGAEVGESDDALTFLRGPFDSDRVRAAQRANGYRELDVDGRIVMSLSEDADFNFDNPVQRVALVRLNNSTFLDDGTLVYTPTLALLEAALAPRSTVAESPFVAQAMATLDQPLIFSTLLGPSIFLPDPLAVMLANPSPEALEGALQERMEQEPAPLVLTAIAGATPGGPLPAPLTDATPVSDPSFPDSVSKFALVYATSDDAARAASLIETQLATGSSLASRQPWTEVFRSWTIEPNDAHSSLLLTLEWQERNQTYSLIVTRDLGFITG